MASFGSASTQPLATRASGMFGMTFMIRQTIVLSLARHSITKLTCKLLIQYSKCVFNGIELIHLPSFDFA
jgi:hypothetical protein